MSQRKFVFYKDLVERWNITYCRVHLRRMMYKNQFPKCLSLGPGRIGWYEDEIEQWVNDRPRTKGYREDS